MAAERTRVRCPFCQHMPFAEELEKVAAEKPPATVQVFVLKFGGKLKGTGAKGRGSAPGYMELIEVTGSVPEVVETFEAYFDARIKRYLADK